MVLEENSNAAERGNVMVSRFPLKVIKKTLVDDSLQIFQAIKTALSPSFMLMVVEQSGKVVEVNEKFIQLFKYDLLELQSHKFWILNSGYHSDEFWKGLLATLQQNEQWTGELCLRTKNGELVWLNVTILPFVQSNEAAAKYLIVLQDVSNRKAMEKWRHLACHHELTNLPNRRMFRLSYPSFLERAERFGSNVAVFFIDLNNFKLINDSFGHSVGDALLQEVADRFQANPLMKNRIFHFGGDEFVLLFEFSDSLSEFHEAIQTIFDRPIQLGGHSIPVSISIGGSIYPDDSTEMDILLKLADSAMFSAKEDGETCIRMYAQSVE